MNKYEKYELQKHSSMKNPSYLFDRMNIDNDILVPQIKNKNPCSIKPSFYENPKDINLNDIFIRLVDSQILFNGENNIYIKLSEEKIIKRKYVIDSIKRFIILYNIKYKIFYNIIFLFDILIFLDNQNKVINNFELLGLGSTLLMIKYMHEDNKIFSLNIFQKMYERIYYPKLLIKEIEILCLKLINYYMNFPTPLLFMEMYFLNGFLFKNDNIKNDTCFRLYNMALGILEKILITSNEYNKYSPIDLCSGIISYCREYYGLEKWPKILSQIFNITEKNFENIIQELIPIDDNLNIKNISIMNKLFDKRFNEKMVIFKRYKEKIEDEKNKQNNLNRIENHHINKDIKVNINNNKEGQINSQLNIFKINNANMKINLNYRTTEDLKNSALFRKINIKYNDKSFRDLNSSNSLNNINRKNELHKIINQEKTIENKASKNSYKTPDKISNNKNESYIYNQNKKLNKKCINHHKNISNITIVNKNDNIFDFLKEHHVLFNRNEINNYESNKYGNINLNERIINVDKNEERKIYKKFRNKINEDIKKNLNEKEEIRVRVKEYYFRKRKNTDQKDININNAVLEESNMPLGNKDDDKNINSKTIVNNTYVKNIILKNKNSLLNFKNPNNNDDKIVKKKSEQNPNKNIYINRLSSCNNKFKSKIFYGHFKEDDYSNETTSENSHNISIRQNYFRLNRLKLSSLNMKNENVTINSGNNIETDINNNINQVIKCNIKYKEKRNNINYRDKSHNEIKYSKIKDCLKIGSTDRRFLKRINDN